MEFSTLNGYKVKDKKAIRYYDTVADMKSDTTLKNGMHVKTKGYYEAEDGGHGEYIIVNDNTLVDDSGIIHTLNNGLKGKLLIDDFINIKQLGAKDDGSNDIGFLINNVISKGFTNIYIPKGQYLVNTTINLNNISGINIIGEMYGTYKTTSINSTRLIGNTGDEPIISLIGARHICIEKLCLVSDENNDNPSTLGMLQGCSETNQFSQWINLTNLHINLITSDTANDNNGSIGIYNWQSELNNYINVFVTADIPVYLTRDDELQIASNNGGILPSHDSLTGNTYNNLETQSKKEYTICIGGDSCNFNGFYGQGTIKFLTNVRGDNQINNVFIQGVVERNNENTIGATIEITPNARLQDSFLQITSVGHTRMFYTTASDQQIINNIIKISGNFSENIISDTKIRYMGNLIYKGNLEIQNIYSQGNIIIGGNASHSIANNNLSILNDGTYIINGIGLGVSTTKPTRTDLPDMSTIINGGNNRFVGWRYSSSIQTWRPIGVGVPVETDSGSISQQTPIYVGQLLHNVTDDSIWISYGTSQGNWKQITN